MDETRNDRSDGGGQLEAPAKLVAALNQMRPQRIFVPPSVDDTVLKAARNQFAKPARSSLKMFPRWLLWPSLATACLLLGFLTYRFTRPTSSPASSSFAREDLNHDGRVDIRDAFQLARALQSDAKPPASLDLNGDGVIDRRDAEVIALQAVKLEKGGPS